MALVTHEPLTVEDYDREARAYERTLTLENLMEATPQADQRLITLTSFEQIMSQDPQVHCFNELLVMYREGEDVHKVVPDNFIVLGDVHQHRRGHYPVELEPLPIFMVLEYVSPHSARKDYDENFAKYEQKLHVPYCLQFDPAHDDLRVHELHGERYRRLTPDRSGFLEVPRLDLRVALLDGYVRFWYRGELVELPSALLQQLQDSRRKLQAADKMLQATGKKLQVTSDKLQATSDKLQATDEELRGARSDRDAFREFSKKLVARLAAQRGRQDILDQLPVSDDLAQLNQWLSELNG